MSWKLLLVLVCQNDILGHFHLFELVHVELVLFGEEAELFLVPDVQFVDVDVFQTIEQRLELLVILQFNFPLDFLSLFGVISWLAALRVSTVFVAGAISADESAQRCGGTSCGSIRRTESPIQSGLILTIGRVSHSNVASSPRTSRITIGSDVHGDPV